MTLKERIQEAREAGCTAITIDGVRYELGASIPQPQHLPVPELEPADIVVPQLLEDMPTDQEILYYATSYWDVLQEQKAEQARMKAEQPNG